MAVLDRATDVSVGFAHACALTEEGAVLCWGWNASGQAGAGTADITRPTALDVPGVVLSAVDRIVAGFDTTCALTANTMQCWGAQPLVETGVHDVAIGADHVCALRDEALTCWGAEPGGGRPPLTAPLVFPLRGGDVASGGIDHLCFTDADAALRCLGKNTHGQLGRGDFRRPDGPSAVFELGPVTSVAVGAEHTCAVSGDDTWCWGQNDAGQLGTDDGLGSAVPRIAPP